MLKDMEDYIKTSDTASLADGYVYIRRETDTYAQSLLAAATELNSATSHVDLGLGGALSYLFQNIEPEIAFAAHNVVPMQLLNQDEQERADLQVVFPKAKVEGNCITASHYACVVKSLLNKLKVSNNCFEEVPHPRAYARLLCRLSRELRSAPSLEPVALEDKFSDPTDYDGCLGEMLKDMEDYIKTADKASLADGYHVYVRRETDTYVHSLLAAATELNSVAP